MFWPLADICLLKIIHNRNFKRSSSSNFKSLKTEQINSHTVCIITKTDSTFSQQQGNYVTANIHIINLYVKCPFAFIRHTQTGTCYNFFSVIIVKGIYHVQQKLMMSTFVAPDSIIWNAQCTEGLVVGGRGQIESH